MSIKSLAALATLSDDAKRFDYDHGIWAMLKSTIHNAPYAEAVSKLAERRSRKRFSPESARKLAGVFYDHAVDTWGVGDDTGTRADFLDNMTSEGLDYITQQMMRDASNHDNFRDADDDDGTTEAKAEGNSVKPSAGT